MGQRGPAPQPTALKIIRGNPGKRKLNKNEPVPISDKLPECPEHLDDAAKREWERLLPILAGMRVITEADYIILGSLCQQHAMLIEARRQLGITGLLFKTPNGSLQQSPLVSIVSNCTKQVTVLSRELGLSPSSRGRLQVQPDTDKPASKWAALKAASSDGA